MKLGGTTLSVHHSRQVTSPTSTVERLPTARPRTADQQAKRVLAEAHRRWITGPGRPFGSVLLWVVTNKLGGDIAAAVRQADRHIATALVENELPDARSTIASVLRQSVPATGHAPAAVA